ncbi:MAG TPA: TonB-dependent receptor [Vicinamibacterales bacterium]|nr:TonB-dependent receptor [Vicinamibacterales bacterium]
MAGLVFVATLVAAVPQPLAAQTTSASITGLVQDAQGGVLPGVTITLTSRTQGNTLTTVTDAEGRFIFAIVRPDTYSLTATLEGFKTLERTNVVVNANDKFYAGTMVLEVGDISEEVTVTSRVSEVQAESGERGFVLESQALQNIAANGRMLFNFATLVPGSVPIAQGMSEAGSVSAFSVNGQRPNSNNITIDGVANIDTGDNGGNMATTNIDAVAEFKILTNAYQAEYGRAVGGQVQVVTKSGTREFHGSGYWYGRRSNWNAETWINNRAGLKSPKTSRDDSGYTLGGPIYIPGRFNTERNKLFFFFSQEHQRRTEPGPERLARVPTALERAGDFSQSVDTSGNPFPYIRDWTTGLPCNSSDTRGCFQDGGVLGRIPQSRLYQPGLAILNLYPMPNTSRGQGLNFTSQEPNKTPRREDLLRIDFQATDAWRITGRYMNTKEDILQAYGTTWAGNGSDQLPTPTLFKHPGRNMMLSAVGILNSSTTLELSWGRASNSLNYELQLDKLFRSNSGLTGLPYLFPDAVQADYVPWFQFRGGRTANAGQYQTDRGPFTNENITHDVIANLTKVWGRHASKFGFYFQDSFKPQSAFTSFNATINFADDAANPFDTGYGYANAALGVFTSYQQANKYALPEWRYKNFEWYLQDNWKANTRLTLDYGVRFYYLTPQWDKTLQASNFLPDRYDPSRAVRLYTPAIVNGVRVGVDPANPNDVVPARFIGRIVPGSGERFNGSFQAGQGINEELQDGPAFRVSPRLGFAYDLTGNTDTVLRGGWGIFYDRPQGNMVFDMITNAPGVVVSAVQYGMLQTLTGGGAGADPNPVVNLNPTGYDFKPPQVMQWNLGIQRKMFTNFIFDIAYVGSKSDDLLRQSQINAVPLGARFRPENQDPTLSGGLPGSNALPNDLLRPFKGYGDIRMWDYSGYSNYHALQTSVNRRFDNGFMFNAFYVWSKALGIANTDFSQGAPLDEAEVRRLDYGLLDYDRPHNFVVNFVYQTPNVAAGPLGILANDWQISGVYRWTSGRPYAIGFSIPGVNNNNNLTGNTGAPAARVRLLCDPGRGWSGDPYRQIANVNCFAPAQPGSVGDESARFFVRNPPINNLDLSLSKRFRFYKDTALEVRLDAFNALNHTQFTGVNGTINFAGLNNPTITNLPYDANGNLVRQNGFGAITGVAPPRTLQLVTRFTF